MFDIGVLEIGLIFVVALLVIGPERLPAVARNIGYWIGKIRNFVSTVQEDFQREVVKAEELKKLLEEQSKIKDVHEILEKTVDESRKTVSVTADLSNDSVSQSQDESSEKQEKIMAEKSDIDDESGSAKNQNVDENKKQ